MPHLTGGAFAAVRVAGITGSLGVLRARAGALVVTTAGRRAAQIDTDPYAAVVLRKAQGSGRQRLRDGRGAAALAGTAGARAGVGVLLTGPTGGARRVA